MRVNIIIFTIEFSTNYFLFEILSVYATRIKSRSLFVFEKYSGKLITLDILFLKIIDKHTFNKKENK